MKKFSYIAEISLPGSSGYIHHVLKICDAFSNHYKTELFTFSNKINFKTLKKNYLLKNNFKIRNYEKKITNINFWIRLKYALYIKKKIHKDSIILSRSILSSLILSLFKIRNFLELHHQPQGFTKILFNLSRFFCLDTFINYIVLHKNLKEDLKLKNVLILDDAVDVLDFNKTNYKKNKYEFTFIGSLFDGKGIEIIDHLSKSFPKNRFYIFGDLKTLNQKKFNIKKLKIRKNLFLKGHVHYNYVPKILMSSKFLLMPYQKKVAVNSKNLEVSKYMSPLKLFDYLASGRTIIASKTQVYSHILKDNFNSVLVKNKSLKQWENQIKLILKNKKKLTHLGINSKKMAENYTWSKRVQKIIENYNN